MYDILSYIRYFHWQSVLDVLLVAYLFYQCSLWIRGSRALLAAIGLTVIGGVALLARWLRQDVLAVRGPDYADRGALYDWLVAELRVRECHCPHKIRPVRCLLENQRDALLAFAKQLDQDLGALGVGAHSSGIP